MSMATGVFSTVEKSDQRGRVVAVKSYKRQHGKLVMDHYKRELWALRAIDVASEQEAVQNHVIYLMDTQSTPSAQTLTFPFYEHTLMDFVNHGIPKFAFEAVYQAAQGLSFLHNRGIVHCDLSPSNILVDASMSYLAIADFGCAHRVNESNMEADQEEIGTRYYKAPEHLFGHQVYTPATDIWSLGTIFCHLLGGRPLFNGESDIELIGQIVRALGSPSEKVLDEELQYYPDTNKLVFFGAAPQSESDDDDDYEEDGEQDDSEISDCNENVESRVNAQDIQHLLQAHEGKEGLPDAEPLIRGMLTWSVKERIAASEVLKLACPST